MDGFGLQGILLWGSFPHVVPYLIIATPLGMFSKDWPSHTAEGWTSVAFLLFSTLAFGASWDPVPWPIQLKSSPQFSEQRNGDCHMFE
jgi:hypothetical protein